MQNRIHKLSALLINQIAAGEVVTRPASVVKELVENAIDAGATQISIYIEQGGLGLIQVVDNGKGIHPDDMTLAVTRHATSKLADVSELVGINSLGFRGEALASIAAVSHFTLSSSQDDSGIGQQIQLSGSDVSQAQIQPIVKSKGTTVTVRDLYFNVPARRANLKSMATEFNHIEQVIQRLAISFAQIQLDLYHQNKQRFSLNSVSTHEDNQTLSRLEQALSVTLSTYAQPFELLLQHLQSSCTTNENAKVAKVMGWLFVKTNQDPLNQPEFPKLIYINQRLVTDFAISQALQKSARQADINQFGYALFFELPMEWINVNIHPSKQQVKIQPLTNILATLNQSVLNTLKSLQTDDTFQSNKLTYDLSLKGSTSQNAIIYQNQPYRCNDDNLEPLHALTYTVQENQLNYRITQQEQSLIAQSMPVELANFVDNKLGELVLVQAQLQIYLIQKNIWQNTRNLAIKDKLQLLDQQAICHYSGQDIGKLMLKNLDFNNL